MTAPTLHYVPGRPSPLDEAYGHSTVEATLIEHIDFVFTMQTLKKKLAHIYILMAVFYCEINKISYTVYL